MKIFFNEEYYNSDYSNDGAAQSGRMETIIDALTIDGKYTPQRHPAADLSDIELVHTKNYIDNIKQNDKVYQMAMLAAGGAIAAAKSGFDSEAAFACIRPPGHHAYPEQSWGYCYFSNMAIALKKLKSENMIKSAFVLDFDAHTGDGTINSLSDWKECKILNPMAEDSKSYLKIIEEYSKNIDYVDIIAVCAGFDSYIKDVGKKLTTFDFYIIGVQMKLLAKRMGHNRRFAILEGGYYLPDLGKNVLAFCQGLQ